MIERPIGRAVHRPVWSKEQTAPALRHVLERETAMPQRLLWGSARPHDGERYVPDVLPVDETEAHRRPPRIVVERSIVAGCRTGPNVDVQRTWEGKGRQSRPRLNAGNCIRRLPGTPAARPASSAGPVTATRKAQCCGPVGTSHGASTTLPSPSSGSGPLKNGTHPSGSAPEHSMVTTRGIPALPATRQACEAQRTSTVANGILTTDNGCVDIVGHAWAVHNVAWQGPSPA
jgi:hypothetical protein